MDYISFDNSFWTFLHVITYFYPHNPTMDEKKNYFLFLKNFRNFIPCDTCKAHYIEHNNGQNNLNNELIQNTVPQLTTVERANEQESSTEPTPEQRSEPVPAPLAEPTQEPAPTPLTEAVREPAPAAPYHPLPATLPPTITPPPPEYIHSNEMLNDEYINSLDYLQSKENLSRSMVDFHNIVNKKLNKPEYTYDEAKEYYEKIMENSEMLNKSNLFP